MRKIYTKEELIAFEDRIEKLYLESKIGTTFHMSGGNEDQLIEIFKQISDDDYVLSNHRNHYHALLKGVPAEELEKMIINGQSMFVYSKENKFLLSAIIGGTPAIAAGIAWALKRRGSKQKVWCFVGDGTEDNGHLFEAVRYVEGFDLPCVFVIESNGMSVDASNEIRWGKSANFNWENFSCVIKYEYKMTKHHIRAKGMVDLSKFAKKYDKDIFPEINYPKIDLNKNNEDIKYVDAVKKSMVEYSKNENVIFIGYNTLCGNIMGTIKDVPDSQKLETPVAENLMMGLAIGSSLEDYRPVVYFERHDFMTVAMDAIVNHLDKIERLSLGQFKTPVIIRAIVFDHGPFYSGPTHSQDFTEGFKKLVSFPILEPSNGNEVIEAFKFAFTNDCPTMIVERKKNYS